MAKNPLRKLLDDSVQVTEVSRKQAEAAVKSLVKAGEVRRSETEAAVQALLDRGRRSAAQLAEAVQSEVAKQVGWLANRVDDLEEQLESFVTRVAPGRPSTGSSADVTNDGPTEKPGTEQRPPAKRPAASSKTAAAKKTTKKQAAATKKSPAKAAAAGRSGGRRKVATSRPT